MNPQKTTTNSKKNPRYIPKYPEKYVGDVTKIICRSSWETRFCQFCDLNPNILEWASEEIAIPYIKPHPTKRAVHRYYPDFYIKTKNKQGLIEQFIIELKPHKEAVLKKKSTLYDRIAIMINEAKWKAAVQFCEAHNMKFKVITEKTLFKLN